MPEGTFSPGARWGGRGSSGRVPNGRARNQTMNGTATRRTAFVVALVCAAVAFFAPLIVISAVETDVGESVGRHAREATVGIGVILRATARRLFRTGSGSILRTSFGAYARAAARAMTRRMVKVASRVAIGSVTKDVVERERAQRPGVQPDAPGSTLVAVVLGFAGLFASFWGILRIAPAADVAALTTERGISHPLAAALGAAPILVYAALNVSAGRLFGVRVRLRTALDGLLLQGYFTGAGSFLPMTTDVEYHGATRDRAKTAGVALGGLFVLHLVLGAVGVAVGSEVVSFAATTFLLYCFICSFPIKPLEGYELWRASKLVWVLLWSPILAAFVSNLPAEFGAIL